MSTDILRLDRIPGGQNPNVRRVRFTPPAPRKFAASSDMARCDPEHTTDQARLCRLMLYAQKDMRRRWDLARHSPAELSTGKSAPKVPIIPRPTPIRILMSLVIRVAQTSRRAPGRFSGACAALWFAVIKRAPAQKQA